MPQEPSTARLQEAMERLDEAFPEPRGAIAGLPPPIVIPAGIRSISGVAKALTRDLAVFNTSVRRIAWALLRVAEALLADMEERRLVQDDRVELQLAAWRRCCLGDLSESMLDVSNTLDAVMRAAVARDSWIEASGYEAINRLGNAARAMINKYGSAEGFTRSSNSAAQFLQREDEQAGTGKARVFTLLVEALAETGKATGLATRRNPGGTTSAPMDIDPGVRSAHGLADHVARNMHRPTGRERYAWAMLRLSEAILRDMEARRLVADDRPELALDAWRRWCGGDYSETLPSIYDALTESMADARKRPGEEWLGYEAIALAAHSAVSARERSWSKASLERVVAICARFMREHGEPVDSVKDRVVVILMNAFAEPAEAPAVESAAA